MYCYLQLPNSEFQGGSAIQKVPWAAIPTPPLLPNGKSKVARSGSSTSTTNLPRAAANPKLPAVSQSCSAHGSSISSCKANQTPPNSSQPPNSAKAAGSCSRAICIFVDPSLLHPGLTCTQVSKCDTPPPPRPLSFPTPGKTVPRHPLGDGHQVTVPHPPLGDRTTTIHAHLQAQKLQHKTKEFSIRYVQRAAHVRRPTP